MKMKFVFVDFLVSVGLKVCKLMCSWMLKYFDIYFNYLFIFSVFFDYFFDELLVCKFLIIGISGIGS